MSNVIDLGTVKQRAFDEAIANAIAMARLCNLVGVPERLGEFIAARKSLSEVHAILEREAAPPSSPHSNGAAT